jgi:hypothetical protein
MPDTTRPKLPPVDPELNRRLIAQRLRWPNGALEEVIGLERDHPEWKIWWTGGGLPVGSPAGFHASLQRHRQECELHAPTPAELRPKLEAAEEKLGPDPLTRPWHLRLS